MARVYNGVLPQSHCLVASQGLPCPAPVTLWFDSNGMYVCTCACICIFIYVRNVHISLYACVGGGTCTMVFCSPYVCLYVCMYMYVCSRTATCMYACDHMYVCLYVL